MTLWRQTGARTLLGLLKLHKAREVRAHFQASQWRGCGRACLRKAWASRRYLKTHTNWITQVENILTMIFIHIAKVWFYGCFSHVDKDLQKSGHILPNQADCQVEPNPLGVHSSCRYHCIGTGMMPVNPASASQVYFEGQFFLRIMTKHSAVQLCVIDVAIFEPTVTKPQESQDGSCQFWNFEIQLVDFKAFIVLKIFEAQPWPNLELSNCASSPAASDLKKKSAFDGCSCMFLASWILMRFHLRMASNTWIDCDQDTSEHHHHTLQYRIERG